MSKDLKILNEIKFNIDLIKSQKNLLKKVILSDFNEDKKDIICKNINSFLIDIYKDTRELKNKLTICMDENTFKNFCYFIPSENVHFQLPNNIPFD